jgi:hypothetical protein
MAKVTLGHGLKAVCAGRRESKFLRPLNSCRFCVSDVPCLRNVLRIRLAAAPSALGVSPGNPTPPAVTALIDPVSFLFWFSSHDYFPFLFLFTGFLRFLVAAVLDFRVLRHAVPCSARHLRFVSLSAS